MKKILLVLVTSFIATTSLISSELNTEEDKYLDQKLKNATRNKTFAKDAPLVKSVTSTDGVTLLMIASAIGDEVTVNYLTKTGANINEDVLPLKNYKSWLDKKFFDEWKKYTVFVTKPSTKGYTALMYAVMGGHKNVARLLILKVAKDLGADEARKYINAETNEKWTALKYAVTFIKAKDYQEDQNRVDIFNDLITYGANTNITGTFEEGTLDMFGMIAKYGHTSLVVAAEKKYTKLWEEGKEELIEKTYGTDKDLLASLNRAESLADQKGYVLTAKALSSFKNLTRTHSKKDTVVRTCKNSYFRFDFYNKESFGSQDNKLKTLGEININISYAITLDGTISNIAISPVFNKGSDASFFSMSMVAKTKQYNTPIENLYGNAQAFDWMKEYNPSSKKTAFVILTAHGKGESIYSSKHDQTINGVIALEQGCLTSIEYTSEVNMPGTLRYAKNLYKK